MEERIDKLLSDPESMSKIIELAKTLSGGGEPDKVRQEEQKPTPEKDPLSALNISPGLVETLGKALNGMNDKEQRITLLQAIRPLVKDEHRELIDNAIRAFKLAKAARTVLTGLERQDNKNV